MVSIVADQKCLLKELRLFVEPVEVFDAGGQLMGVFVPASRERGPQAESGQPARTDWAEVERRRLADGPKFSTKEVFERLLAQTSDEPTRAYLREKIDRLTERDRCATP